MLYSCQVWHNRITVVAQASMEAVHARGCRTCLNMSRCSNAAAVCEAGFRSLACMAHVKMIKSAYKISTNGQPHPLLSGRFGPLLAPHAGLLPLQHPQAPPDPALDKVWFFVKPCVDGITRASSKVVRQRANVAQRVRMADHLVRELGVEAQIFDGWSDGSIDSSLGRPIGGGAFAIWPPLDPTSATNDPLPTSPTDPFSCAAPIEPCSYPVEEVAFEAMVDRMSLAVDAWRAATSSPAPVGVRLMTDGQSVAAHAECGPLRSAIMSPRIWQCISRLTARVDCVAIGFMFAHCDDPAGDLVDARAKLASARCAASGLVMNRQWHVDAARPETRRVQAMHDLFVTAKVRLAARAIDATIPAIGCAPPNALTPAQASTILRLRSGVWPRLGRQFYQFRRDVPAAEQGGECKLCGHKSHRSASVIHLFECPAAPSELTVATLFSSDPSCLRKCIEHCFKFVPDVPLEPESDVSSGSESE
jgi:hypothetical protein